MVTFFLFSRVIIIIHIIILMVNILRHIYLFYKELKERHFTTMAGAIAFFVLVNGGSLFFLIASLLKVFNIVPYEDVLKKDYFTNILHFFDQNTKRLNVSHIIMFITSIWTSSTLFYHIMLVGEIIYNDKRKRFFLRHRLIAIILVLVFMILILLVLLLIILANKILKYITSIWLKSFFETILLMGIPSIIIIFFLLFVPPNKLTFRKIIPGYLFTISSWILSTFSLRLYLSFFSNFKALYGIFTMIIIGVIYIYILIVCLIIGLIVNEKTGKK